LIKFTQEQGLHSALFFVSKISGGCYMNEDKQKILTVYQQIDDAMVNKDTEILDNILDDNYVLVHMTGYHQPKQNFLNDNAQFLLITIRWHGFIICYTLLHDRL
jgi:hypothetical protein